MRYWLSIDCHICIAGGKLVCFNTKSGKYHEFPATDANLIATLVSGWPVVQEAGRPDGTPQPSHSTSDVAEGLLASQILVSDRRAGKSATPISLPPPTKPLLEEYEDVDVADARPGAILQFLRATISAAGAIYLMGWERLIHRQACRRRRSLLGVSQPISPDQLARLKQTVSLFRRLRPLLWRTQSSRRLENLILLKLIRYQGIPVSWVHAISANPRKARCWIQCGEFIVDEPPGAVSTYVPVVAL